MTATHRIILNATATYGRTIFTMALGLFSSRWVLERLGKVDYGLMGVVGGLIIFITFLNNVTAGSCSRFFALSIGKGDPEETNRWFNTALSIHTLLPAVLILIGWPVGEWAIVHFLNIPPDRLDTALWVFRFSLVSTFWSMSATPYRAMFIAKQRIAELSLGGMITSIINFGFIYWLTTYKGDAWLMYAGGSVLLSLIFITFRVVRARYLFPECRIHFSRWYDKKRLTEVFSFSSWSLIGHLSGVLKNSGIAIALNKFFPPGIFPAVNASYSIAGVVATHTVSLSGAFMGALSPEITATYGRGNIPKAIAYSWRASKFATFLTSFFAIPLLVEMDYALQLWLRNPPEYAAAFCILMLLSLLIEKVGIGQAILVMASGRIRGFQCTVSGMRLMALPLVCLFLFYGAGPLSVIWVTLTIALLAAVGRIFWFRHLFGIPLSAWFKQVMLPCATLGGGTYLLGLLVHHTLALYGTPPFLRLVSVALVTCGVFALGIWNFGLRKDEKKYVISQAKTIRSKITGKKNQNSSQLCGKK